MAKKSVLVSDMSGDEIPENSGAVVTIKYFDQSKTDRVKELHVTDTEAAELGEKGRPIKQRGRPSGGGNKSGTSTKK